MTKQENPYLEEDADLLSELEAVGPMSTGQALYEQQRRISAIQIKSILRNRKTASDLDRSTSRYSIVLIVFAMVQVVVALSQLLFDVSISEHRWIAFGVITLCAVVVIYIFRAFDPDKLLKK